VFFAYRPTTDRLCAGFRQTEVYDLAVADQIVHGSRDIVDWHVGIDPARAHS
jgi:hypothetical protein